MKFAIFSLLLFVVFLIRINGQSMVTTIGGTCGSSTYGSSNTGLGQFFTPFKTNRDSSGNLYIADNYNACIRKITPGGVVSTFAGLCGTAGTANGVGGAARFDMVAGIGVDTSNNLFVVDMRNPCIKKITPGASVSTHSGSCDQLSSGYVDSTVPSSARYVSPLGITVAPDNTMYIGDHSCIRKIAPAGAVTSYAGLCNHVNRGFVDAPGTNAKMDSPYGLTLDTGGNLYFTDMANHVIRKVTPGRVVTSYVGAGTVSGNSFGHRLTEARLMYPEDVTIDSVGNMYIADSWNGCVRRLITSADTVVPFVGVCGVSGTSVGQATTAKFNYPRGILITPSFAIVTDSFNHCIKKVTLDACATSANFVYDSSKSKCVLAYCAAGTQANTVTNVCDTCHSGKFKASFGMGPCSFCAAGWESSADRKSCVACVSGKYRLANTVSQCLTCPLNSQCPTTGFSCNAGYGYDSATGTCNQCAAGYFKSSVGNTVCTTCSFGSQPSSDKTACVTCSSGSYRPSGSTSLVCIGCPLNSTCSGSSFSCNSGHELTSTCTQCKAGYFKAVTGNQLCSVCPYGSQPNLVYTTCVICPSGSYRPQGSTSNICIACPANTVCSGSYFECKPGNGYDTATETCSQCAAGYFKSATSNTTCATCPAGSQPSSDRTSCLACPTGTYRASDTTSNVCINCPTNSQCSTTGFLCSPGYAYDSATKTCSICPTGYFKNTAANTACSLCPAGNQPSLDKKSCVSCPLGSYRPSGSTSNVCIVCPVNSTCSGSTYSCLAGYELTSSCTQCKPGYYKATDGNQVCTTCPFGSQPSSTFTSCVSCPTGSYRPVGSTSNICTSCPLNTTCAGSFFECKPGFGYDSTTKTCPQCSVGYYKSLTGNVTCSTCAFGSQPSIDRTSCLNCPLGSYRPVGSSSNVCVTCPANTICSGSSFECNAGYGYNSMTKTCSQCTTGYFKLATGNVTCNTCPFGSQPSADYISCIECPVGSFRSIGSTSNICINCPTNTTCSGAFFECKPGFGFDSVKKSCPQCQIGFYKSVTGNVTCGVCQFGSQPSSDYSICVACPSGTYRPAGSTSNVCINCPLNTICSGTYFECKPGFGYDSVTKTCSQCAVGYFKSITSNTTCFTCPTGSQPNIGRTACVDCPLGSYRPVGSPSNVCTSCPVNTTCSGSNYFCNPGYGYDSVTKKCIQCATGYYKSFSGNSSCTTCPAGYQPNLSSTSCTNCTSDSYRAANSSSLVCISCPINSMCMSTGFLCNAGYQYDSLANSCQECAIGYVKGSIGNAACSACPSGTQANNDRTLCVACLSGTYRPIGSSSNICIGCPSNTTCSGAYFECLSGYGYETNTKTCPQCITGYYKSITGNTTCSTCPAGSQPSVDRSTCLTCPTGTYRPSNSGSNICLNCPSDSQCLSTSFSCYAGYGYDSATGTCSQCATGYFKSSIANTVCSSCPIGNQPSSDKTYCVTCPLGSYRPSGSTSNLCISCPSYSECSGSSFTCKQGYEYDLTSNSCIQCPIGYFKSTTGNTKCTTCPVGSEPNLDRIACVICPVGSFRPQGSTSSVCATCPENSECSGAIFQCVPGYGYDKVGNSCRKCAYGFSKSTIGNSTCEVCPVGTEPSTDSTYCVSCAPGSYRPSGSSVNTCISCPDNSDCSGSSFQCHSGYAYDSLSNSCVNCALGYYKSDIGNFGCNLCSPGAEPTADRTDCIPCLSGSYRPLNSTSGICVFCPENSVCSGSTFTCDIGYIVNRQGTGCSLCAEGSYRPTLSNLICSGCPSFSSCRGSEFTCLPGYTLDNSGTGCVGCAANYAKSTVGNDACNICPVGSSSAPASQSCIECPSGSYKPLASFSTCITCPANSICSSDSFSCYPGFTLLAENTCERCPLNYAKDFYGNDACVSCDIGTVSSGDRTACVPCLDGSYRPSLSDNSCVSCPSNSDCSGSLFECNAGYTLNDDSNGCDQCPGAYYKSSSGNSACSPCPIGTVNSADYLQCETCPGEKYRPMLSLSICIDKPQNALCNATYCECNPGFTMNSDQTKCQEVPAAPAPSMAAQNLDETLFGLPKAVVFAIVSVAGVVLFIVLIVVVLPSKNKSRREYLEQHSQQNLMPDSTTTLGHENTFQTEGDYAVSTRSAAASFDELRNGSVRGSTYSGLLIGPSTLNSYTSKSISRNDSRPLGPPRRISGRPRSKEYPPV